MRANAAIAGEACSSIIASLPQTDRILARCRPWSLPEQATGRDGRCAVPDFTAQERALLRDAQVFPIWEGTTNGEAALAIFPGHGLSRRR
jgi:hypothetical protein